MHTWLHDLLARYAPGIEEVWLDVDGVMTRQGDLAIYDVTREGHVAFERRDGIQSTRLVPCDLLGQPVPHVVEYYAGAVGEPILEGYRFDTRDGRVIESAVKAGIPLFFISGRNSPAVLKRAINLGAVPYLGEKDKVLTIEQHSKVAARDGGRGWSQVLFSGDGFQDVPTLERAGVSVCPSDGDPRAIATAKWITEAKGGEGVVYEALGAFLEFRGIRPS